MNIIDWLPKWISGFCSYAAITEFKKGNVSLGCFLLIPALLGLGLEITIEKK